MRPRTHAFSLVELLVIVTLIVIVVAIFLPPARKGHPIAPARRNEMNLRDIQISLSFYSEDHHRGKGNPVTAGENYSADFHTASARFALLLGAYLQSDAGHVFISPFETGKSVWKKGQMTTAHFSYALLDITEGTSRAKEWKQFDHSRAVFLSDRSKAIDPTLKTTSLQAKTTTTAAGDWKGAVGWGDTHVETVNGAVMSTQYGELETKNDDLFIEENGDGLMRYD